MSENKNYKEIRSFIGQHFKNEKPNYLNEDGFFYNFTIQIQKKGLATNDVYKIYSR